MNAHDIAAEPEAEKAAVQSGLTFDPWTGSVF
jgi:hypothetical protein